MYNTQGSVLEKNMNGIHKNHLPEKVLQVILIFNSQNSYCKVRNKLFTKRK